MKTVEQLKGEIYYQVQNSGFMRNTQAQVKAHVLDIIDKQTHGNKEKLGFKYEHPVLKKLRAYPLTSLCMDLIQEFLQSFKFKHTLNVFKKQINRDLAINRSNLSKQFSIDLSGKEQAVLLSIVTQLFNGDIKILEKSEREKKNAPTDNFLPRRNNFMNQESLNSDKNLREGAESKPAEKKKKQPFFYDLTPKQPQPKKEEAKAPEKSNQPEKNKKFEIPNPVTTSSQPEKQPQKEEVKQVEEVVSPGKAGKKKKKEQKPPEGATDLLNTIMEKFAVPEEKKKKTEQQIFAEKRAFSEQKVKQIKKQEGTNKIRGISMGKMGSLGGGNTLSSFMKFSSFNQQPNKNQSNVDEDMDQFQQSNSSLRKNPLYSSSESGFDQSYGYDQSVDSMAIDDYQYSEKARKFGKKY